MQKELVLLDLAVKILALRPDLLKDKNADELADFINAFTQKLGKGVPNNFFS